MMGISIVIRAYPLTIDVDIDVFRHMAFAYKETRHGISKSCLQFKLRYSSSWSANQPSPIGPAQL